MLDSKGVAASGYFDHPVRLAQAVEHFDGHANIYVTLNPVLPDLLDRAKNRLIVKPTKTTADGDILHRRWLFVDIDAKRPSGVSATDEELNEAAFVLGRLTQTLSKEGWPDPLTCLSGNGYYALYPIGLPNTVASRDLVKRVLAGFDRKFSSATAHIDVNVANAARLVGLVGSLKVKGASITERPHRRSEILNLPDKVVPVPLELLQEIAGQASTRPRTPEPHVTREARSLDDLLDEAKVDCRRQPPDSQGIIWYQVRICPFHGADQPYECGVGQAPDGHYTGKCFHDETKGWREWKRALGLDSRHTPSPARDKTRTGENETGIRFARTDAGNAELLAHLSGDQLRYDHRRSKWFTWRGHHWGEDADGEVARLALETARERYRRAEAIANLRERQDEARFAIASENRPRLEAMLAQARSLHPIACAGEGWDKDRLRFGVTNGVIDLKTGRLSPGCPTDNITLFADISFDPAAECPRWCSFLMEVFEANEELIDYVWRAVGYSLSGDISAQCLFVCFGQGANGKSVFLSVLRELLGLYAYNAPFATFELRNRTDITNDLAALAGRRLVTASETNEGTRLNEARIKALTGGDPVTARFLYGEHFTFRPQAKIFLAVNHLPVVEDLSFGFWRRVRLLPFTRTFAADADPHLEERLRSELPGILAWAVQGALAWQKHGLTPPTSVLAATESYRETSDLLADFIGECLVAEEPRSVGSAEAYAAYQAWARAQHMTDREMLTLTAFGRKMGDRFASKKTKAGRRFLGVGLCGAPVQEVLA